MREAFLNCNISLGTEALPRLQEVDVVGARHVLKVGVPPLQRRDLALQLGHEALGPPLRLPLLLLQGRNQLGLRLLDGAHQLRHHPRALLHLPESAGLNEPRVQEVKTHESSTFLFLNVAPRSLCFAPPSV